ncbi:MAG: amino acid ABC transporter permease [Micropruina sp.]|uniref:amino acid ABC transporter permease n=1 Tax=Micropruina sp. TaxID=2737536 RepID=UPI0039E486A1
MSAPTVLFDAPGPKARLRHNIFTVIGALLIAGVLYLALAKLAETGQLDAAKWTPFLTPSAWISYLIPGLIGTLTASVISVALAGIFGLAFGLGRLAQRRWIRIVCGIVVEFFRAVPVLLMMFFAFNLYSRNGVFLPSINPLAAVVTALTLYNGSVIAELVRSGVHSLPKGQAEAGLSIGLTAQQTLLSIQLPQALVAMLPALMGQLVVVIKDSALGYGITYGELLNWSKTLGSAYANTVPAYLVAAVLFIVLNYTMTKLAAAVERRLKKRPVTAGPLTTTMPNIVQGGAEPGGPSDNLIEPYQPPAPKD